MLGSSSTILDWLNKRSIYSEFICEHYMVWHFLLARNNSRKAEVTRKNGISDSTTQGATLQGRLAYNSSVSRGETSTACKLEASC